MNYHKAYRNALPIDARNHAWRIVLALSVTVLSAGTADAQSPITIFGTGVVSSGVLASDGVVDSHYSLISSVDPATPGPNAYVVNSTVWPIPPWIAEGPSSKWIGPYPYTSGAVSSAAGAYTYRTTFNLTGFNPSTAVLTGQYAADDGASIQLNGVTVFSTSQGFGAFQSFTINSGFAAGLNTLDFVVQNAVYGGTNPTGLRVDISGTASASSGGSSSAVFVKLDTSTQGNWKGVYGSNGYNVFNDTVSYPSYVTVTPSGNLNYTWAASTSDQRGLQKASSTTDRIAATWYTPSSGSYTIDLTFGDQATHQLAVYCVDWDTTTRTQTIAVTDANGVTLDTRSMANFNGGQYLVWNMSGHVRLVVTWTAGWNGVISGLFFSPPPSSGSSSASFVKLDTTTQGNWKGVYGSNGYNVIDDTASYPSYVTVTPNGNLNHIWTASTSDPRALQKASSATDRIAATWFTSSSNSYSIDLAFGDQATHQLAVYCIDWDTTTRTQTLTITDANGVALDTRSMANFNNGQYLVWNLSGHVRLVVTWTAGYNGVISGLFFGTGAGSSTLSLKKEYIRLGGRVVAIELTQ
jgi:hypothetical protein